MRAFAISWRSRARRLGLVAGVLTLASALGSSVASAGSSRTAAATSSTSATSSTPGALLTYDYDNSRSGDDATAARIATVGASPLWDDRSLDGGVYGEPLVYNGVVYVATERDTLYAISLRSGAVMWSLTVGTPVSLAVVHETPGVGCGNIDPLGITGTPVIDPASGELYLAAEVLLPGQTSWVGVRHELLAISLAGHRVLWRRDVDPPGANNPSTYYIPAEQQRPALTLANGRIYVLFGGLYGDCGQYHGYVVDLPTSGRGALQSYEVPTAREGAIWETNGAVVNSAGDLYVATGNGSSSRAADYDEGDSVIELSPRLRRLGVWAPANWVALNADDGDLGSAGPIAIPGSDLLFMAGKVSPAGSVGYLFGGERLSGVGGAAASGAVCRSGGVYGADATEPSGSGALVFAPCGGGTEALRVDVAAGSFSQLWSAASGSPNGPPIIAGGVVLALNWNSGGLYGLDPGTGAVDFHVPTDALEHFATPAVVSGHLLVPTARGVEAFATTS